MATRINVGALRSQMTLQIHTKQAARLWYGRKPQGDMHGIFGLNRFLFIADQINTGSRNDDPYSDWFMLRVEEKLDETKVLLEQLDEEVEHFYSKVPVALKITNNLSLAPAELPVFSGSHIGYLAIYIMAQYDDIVRKILQAQHIAIISRSVYENLIDKGERYLRILFTLIQTYSYSGINRQDILQGTASAKIAIEKFGTVPEDIFNGTKRSRFSIPLKNSKEAEQQERTSQALSIIISDKSGLNEADEALE